MYADSDAEVDGLAGSLWVPSAGARSEFDDVLQFGDAMAEQSAYSRTSLVLIMSRSKTARPVIDGVLVDIANRFGEMLSGDVSLSVR